jgi:hypothetical protein
LIFWEAPSFIEIIGLPFLPSLLSTRERSL